MMSRPYVNVVEDDVIDVSTEGLLVVGTSPVGSLDISGNLFISLDGNRIETI